MKNVGFTVSLNDKKLKKNFDFTTLPKAFESGKNNGIKYLIGKVYLKLEENLVKYGLGGTRLSKSIKIRYYKNDVKIEMDSPYGKFVEFGTGIMGERKKHPIPWDYDINNHGDKGWFYEVQNGAEGVGKTHMYNGKLYAWTRGTRSKPFMYDTSRWTNLQGTKIVRRKINEEFKRLGK